MATTYSALADEEKKKVNQIYDKQKQQINVNADASITEAERSYDEQQRAVAVQKLINERKVAESIANLGLTDSGLNRTQQTAVQLSAANAGYNLNRQKQQTIDKINLQRDNDISQIEQQRLATDIEIDNAHAQAEANAAAAQTEANEQASWVIGKNSATLNFQNAGKSFASVGVGVTENIEDGTVTYTDYKSGQSRTFKKTQNPYTGTDNKALVEEFTAFDNGYQPKGVKGQGKFDTNKNGYVIVAGDFYWTTQNSRYGVRQNVFKITKNGTTTYWVWDGGNNEYFQVTQKNGVWEEV